MTASPTTHRRPRRPTRRGPAALLAGAALAVTAAVLASTGSVGSPSRAASGGLRYVALGDSYSAASGVLPPDPTSPLCARSTRNYPHLIAQRIGARGASGRGDARAASRRTGTRDRATARAHH